jgi:hypothetical protein
MRTRPSDTIFPLAGRSAGFQIRLLGNLLDLLGRLLPGPGGIPVPVPIPVPRRPGNGSSRH